MVSSSSPSSPRNTQASTPRRANTPAITGAIRGSAQPIAWAAGWAGLASGPRKLKVVATPSSRRGHRGVPQRRVEGRGEAEGDADLLGRPRPPGRPAGRAGCRAPRARRPSRPCDEAERLPCLTTGAPAPAATIAAIVEMFTDIDRSPPVPTTSSSRPGIVERGGVRRTSPSTRPVDLVDGLALGAQRDGEARRSAPASPRRRGSRPSPRRSARRSGRCAATRAPRTSGQVGVTASARSAGGRDARSAAAAATASASWSGSIGCGTAASARDQVASQASCGRPVSTRTGGHW